jgi:hypothetical protein
MFAKPTWFDLDPDRWAHEEAEVKTRFPQFKMGERVNATRHRYWRGYLQPFEGLESVDVIAAHLKSQSPLSVDESGKLLPSLSNLLPIEVDPTWDLDRRFLVEIVYQEPPAVPVIFCLNPTIDRRAFPTHPHLSTGRHPAWVQPGLGPENALCVFAPHDDVWSWETGTAREVIEFTAIWLGAHAWWEASGKREWLLTGAPHDFRSLLREVRPSDQCQCGSGMSFGSCCRPFMLQAVASGRA